LLQPISITSISSVSPLGFTPDTIWKNYLNTQHCISSQNYEDSSALVAEISAEARVQIELLKQENTTYKKLDNSVLFAIFSARNAVKKAGWDSQDNFGINIGSSRGATQLFEHFHSDFIQNKQAHTLTSPTTTLGNISSWVGHDLQTEDPTDTKIISSTMRYHVRISVECVPNTGFQKQLA